MELPLFPLNSVLYPGVPLRLHIFEDRYKQMIEYCIEEKQPFGVVLIAEGVEAFGPAEPHRVGCTAHILQVQRLPMGRMNLVAIGRDRFRITGLSTQRAYLRASTEDIPFRDDHPRWTEGGADRIRTLFKEYMRILETAGQPPLMENVLPSDPLHMLYFAAYWLQTDMFAKQQLLESNSTAELLPRLVRLFHIETKLLRILLSPIDISNGETPFSLN